MIPCWLTEIKQIVVPIEVSVIAIPAVTACNHPWTGRIFGFVETARFQFRVVALRVIGVAAIVHRHIESIDDSCCIIAGGDEIGLGRGTGKAEPTVVSNV